MNSLNVPHLMKMMMVFVVLVLTVTSYVDSYAIDTSELNEGDSAKDYELSYMRNMLDEMSRGGEGNSPLQKRSGNYKRASINQLIAELERLSGNRYSHNVRPMRFGPMGRK